MFKIKNENGINVDEKREERNVGHVKIISNTNKQDGSTPESRPMIKI